MKAIMLLATAVFAGVTFIAGVNAKEAENGAPRVKISYADLDLSKPAGAKVLLRRINRAASDICGGAPSRGLSAQRRYNRCVDEVLVDAVERLDQPLVSDLHFSVAPTRLANRKGD